MMPGHCTLCAGKRSAKKFAITFCLVCPLLLDAVVPAASKGSSRPQVVLAIDRNRSRDVVNSTEEYASSESALASEAPAVSRDEIAIADNASSAVRALRVAAPADGVSTLQLDPNAQGPMAGFIPAEREAAPQGVRKVFKPLLDSFFWYYWGGVGILFLGFIPILNWLSSHGDGQDGSRVLRAMMKSKSENLHDSDETVDLHETIWALILVAAAGQARFSNGWKVPVVVVAILALAIGALQVVILWILVNDIDMNTKPISDHATVNVMKWCMVLVICMSVVGDLEECKLIVLAIFKIDIRKLSVGRWLPAFVAFWQYAISVYVVRAGCQVVLSFDRAPDIVYSSLAVTFLTHIDNLAFNFVDTVLNLEVDLKIDMGNMKPLPKLFTSTVMFAGFFPMLLAGFLTSRAFLTNEMWTWFS